MIFESRNAGRSKKAFFEVMFECNPNYLPNDVSNEKGVTIHIIKKGNTLLQ